MRGGLVGWTRGSDASSFFRFTQLVFRSAFGLAQGMRIEGLEHLPRAGPCLVVANHISWLDPPALGCCVPHRQLHFMAKQELFERPLLGRLIRALGSFPVERGQADRKSLRTALDLLERGRIVCLFPEGTRGDGTTPGEWHVGAAMLAYHAQVPIVPAALRHTRCLLEDRDSGRKQPIHIRFGAPLRFLAASGAEPESGARIRVLTGNGKQRLLQIQNDCRAAVLELLAQIS